MKRLFLGLLFALPVFASPHDYTLYHPNVPQPRIIEAIAPDPQTHTFPALDTNNAFTGNNTFKDIVGTKYVSTGNPQAWAGADACAWINSAIAALPTLNGYAVGVVDIAGLASNATVACGTTILTKGSPYLWLRGPGRGALIFSCTVNGDCVNTQQGTGGANATTGFHMSGFSVLGQGAANANAVAFHIGDMVGGHFEDLAADNFLGTNSACVWADNVNYFFEENILVHVDTGLVNGAQLGCKKNWKFTNTGGLVLNSSFGHNTFISDIFSVAANTTGFSLEGGSFFDEFLNGTGAVANGASSVFLAMSGLQYSGGPNTNFDGSIFVNLECNPAPCNAPGTLLNVPTGYAITLRAGEIRDSTGFLTPISGGGTVQQFLSFIPGGNTAAIDSSSVATSGANFNSPKLEWRSKFWNGSASQTDAIDMVSIPAASGANPTVTWTALHAGSSGSILGDFSGAFSRFGFPTTTCFGVVPTAGGCTTGGMQLDFGSGTAIAGVPGSLFAMANAGNAFLLTLDKTTQSMGIAGNYFAAGKPIVTSTYTNATTTPSNITGLSFAVAANANYTMTCQLYWQGSASTAGLDITIIGPSAPTSVFYAYQEAPTATSTQNSVSSAFGTKLTGNATVTATTNLPATVTIGLRNGANAGTVQVQGSATGAGTVTVQAGSFCRVQ